MEQERLDNGAPVQIAWPMNSQCTKRGDLSFYAYYTLWRNDRMPMYVVSCTSPRTDGAEFVEAAYSYFQKNKYEPTVRYDEAALVSLNAKIKLYNNSYIIFYNTISTL